MKILGPEERGIQNFAIAAAKKKRQAVADKIRAAKEKHPDHAWASAQFETVVQREAEPEPLPESPVAGVSAAEYDAAIQKMIDADVEQCWEIVQEEYEAALAVDPDDPIALKHKLQHEQHKRQSLKPADKRNGLVIGRPAKKTEIVSTEPTGVWMQTPDGWAVRVSKSDVGQIVKVKKFGGVIQRVRLKEKVGPSLYRVEAI